jgi:putative DNA primase/helicase
MAKATIVQKQDLRSEFNSLQSDDPKEKRLWTTDVTVEKLGELLNENPEGLLILRDELTGWFRMLDRTGHEQDRAFYLEAWNGEGSFTFDRIGRGKTHVKNLTVSILGTIQPAMIEPYLRGALEGYGDDGLIQRFQLLVYPETPKSYRYIDRLPNGRAAARESFRNLHSLTPESIGASRLTDDAGGHCYLKFDNEAQEFFQSWLTDLEIDLRSGTFGTSTMESHLSKYRSLMPSLALIFHLLDRTAGNTSKDAIGISSALLASAWCSYLQKHAEKLYGMVMLSEFDYAKEILNRIKSRDLEHEFTARDIYRKGWQKLKQTDHVKKGLETLTEFGHLTPVIIETGGRQTIHYLIHESLR